MTTILLVDDNPLRASLRKSILERELPAVVRVSDAADALCLVESPDFAARLRLIVISHPIFGISGPDFAVELRARLPYTPLLVLSARSDTQSEYPPISNVLYAQPTGPDDLRYVVRQVLSAEIRNTA